VKPNELLKEYWEKVGVKTILKPYPVGTAWNRIIAGEPEAFETYAQDTDLSFMLDGGIYCGMFLTNWMTAWKQWYSTEGAEGEVPPEEIQQMFDALDTMTSTTDELERTRAGKEILRLHAENVWIIGTVGADPAFGVASKDIGNVPKESIMAGNLAWAKFQRPEQMYFKNQ
jgi:peptide/nickel transport system substrate-binding protein